LRTISERVKLITVTSLRESLVFGDEIYLSALYPKLSAFGDGTDNVAYAPFFFTGRRPVRRFYFTF
jgi:hypothetical protein